MTRTTRTSRSRDARPHSSSSVDHRTVFPRLTQDPVRPVVRQTKERYQSIGLLGEGGMGTVGLFRDADIERLVAVKTLRKAHDLRQVYRFVREARCLGRLEHPGIVPVHDVGRNTDGSYFLVMKHLEGQTLESVIQSLRAGDAEARAAFPTRERLRICRSILQVMEYAHAKSVVHRDLKPANIMIGEHGEVTVVDWGLAKDLEDGADTGEWVARRTADAEPLESDAHDTDADSILGTPLYMSPEQAMGNLDQVGPESDVYSMAVLFYEFLTLEHYLAGRTNLADIVDGVVGKSPRLAYWAKSKGQDRVPIEIAYWLKRGLAKDRTARFASAESMLEELDRAMDGRFDVVCPTTLFRRTLHTGLRFANAHPGLTLGGILGVATLAVLGVASLLVGA